VQHYGSDLKLSLSLDMHPNNTATPIQFSQESGIVLGSLDDVTTKLSVICSNASVEAEEAILFGMNVLAQGNMTMSELVFYPKVDQVLVQNARVLKSHLKLRENDFTKVFKDILLADADTFNQKWAKGWSIANIDPSLAMLTGLLKNTTLTPYVMNKWMYGGFAMQADLPTGVQ
jgi:hypothetical protein